MSSGVGRKKGRVRKPGQHQNLRELTEEEKVAKKLRRKVVRRVKWEMWSFRS